MRFFGEKIEIVFVAKAIEVTFIATLAKVD